ncbi:Uncharacterized protein APZ42_013044 [Daphnia magna]|uniref:Uncharacterized protein n=1 Tax=Daphnia magna TaxID=35525 RepID=A0A162R8B0_9CRUS|nr:Uncharacterized protein APZ42_013044 [Daphnia magna]
MCVFTVVDHYSNYIVVSNCRVALGPEPIEELFSRFGAGMIFIGAVISVLGAFSDY